jgi:hypothetical protein
MASDAQRLFGTSVSCSRESTSARIAYAFRRGFQLLCHHGEGRRKSPICQLRAEENAIEAVGSLPDWGQARSSPQFERDRQGIDADPGPP